MKTLNPFIPFALVLSFLSGCTTTQISSCQELTIDNRTELRRMVKIANKRDFETHVILLETGSEVSDACRSHYIDGNQNRGIPESLEELCQWQMKSQDKYCYLHSKNGEVIRQRIL